MSCLYARKKHNAPKKTDVRTAAGAGAQKCKTTGHHDQQPIKLKSIIVSGYTNLHTRQQQKRPNTKRPSTDNKPATPKKASSDGPEKAQTRPTPASRSRPSAHLTPRHGHASIAPSHILGWRASRVPVAAPPNRYGTIAPRE